MERALAVVNQVFKNIIHHVHFTVYPTVFCCCRLTFNVHFTKTEGWLPVREVAGLFFFKATLTHQQGVQVVLYLTGYHLENEKLMGCWVVLK